jgi:hypothetical protein
VAINECRFEDEAELEAWAFRNLPVFLGECITLGKIQIKTPAGKTGIPDGFAFNFAAREWYLIEAELLSHGVWPHIAEQITRFVVALQSQVTLRKIRDFLFEEILSNGQAAAVAKTLGVDVDRLHQQIELFVEGIQPNVVIFIDEANQDLSDFAHALDMPTRIYRVKKFTVNGTAEYYSPDQQAPALQTIPEEKAIEGRQDLDVVEQLGGGSLITGPGRFKCYRLADGRIIHIKRSKFYEKNSYYWYGINANSLEQATQLGVTHFCFVLGGWGFSLVPIRIVEEFCNSTKVTRNPDGTVRHYHALISPEPEPELYFSSETLKFDISEETQPFS